MNSYKVYFINLEKSVVRKKFMENQFSNYDILFERFPAINGKELSTEFIKYAKNQQKLFKHYPLLNHGEIGLTKSYLDLWKVISNQNEKFAIVFEDDVLINKDFFEDLDSILQNITSEDYVDISGKKGVFKTGEQFLTDLYIIPPRGTTGQIIGRDAAIKLRKNISEYQAPIDVMLQEVHNHKVKMLCSKKVYVTHNDYEVGGTTIQSKDMIKAKKIIRELIRPLWQFSSLLSYKINRCIRNYIFYVKRT